MRNLESSWLLESVAPSWQTSRRRRPPSLKVHQERPLCRCGTQPPHSQQNIECQNLCHDFSKQTRYKASVYTSHRSVAAACRQRSCERSLHAICHSGFGSQSVEYLLKLFGHRLSYISLGKHRKTPRQPIRVHRLLVLEPLSK